MQKRSLRFCLKALALAALTIGVILLAGYAWLARVYVNGEAFRRQLAGDGRAVIYTFKSAHLRGLSSLDVDELAIIGRDKGQSRWRLDLDEAHLVIDPLALLKQRFVIKKATGKGGSFILNTRRYTGDAEADESGEEARRAASEDRLADDQKEASDWGITLRDLQVDGLSDVWIDEYRFLGQASLAGVLQIEPDGKVSVGSVAARFVQGSLAASGKELAGIKELSIQASLDPHDPASLQQGDYLGLLHLALAGDVRLLGLDFLDQYFEETPWLKLGGGEGQVAVDLKIERGLLLAGSSLAVHSQAIWADFLERRIEGGGNVSLNSATTSDGTSRVELVVNLERFSIKERRGSGRHRVQGEGVSLRASTAQNMVSKAPRNWRVQFRMPPSNLIDATIFNELLPRSLDLRILDGRGTVSSDLDLSASDEAQGHGKINFKVVNARVEAEGFRLQGDLDVALVINGAAMSEQRFDISGSQLALSNMRSLIAVDGQTVKDDSWWGVLQFPQAQLTLGQAGEAREFQGRALLRGKDLRPFVAFYAQQAGLPAWAVNALGFTDLKAQADMQASVEKLLVHNASATAGDAALKAWFIREKNQRRENQRRGMALLNYGPLGLGLKLKGDEAVELKLLRASAWYDEQTASEFQ